MGWTKLYLLTVVFILWTASASNAREPSIACPVPPELEGANRNQLVTWYHKLEAARKILVTRIKDYKRECKPTDNLEKIAKCKVAKQAIESTWKQFEIDVEDYAEMRSSATGAYIHLIENEISELNKQIRITKRKLSKYAKNAEQFEADLKEWADLAANARSEAVSAAKEAVVSVTLQRLSIKKQESIKLTKEQLDSVRELLKVHGPILNFANKVSAHKLLVLKRDVEYIKELNNIHTAASLSTSVFLSPDDREDLLTAISKILAVFVTDPSLALILTDAGIITASTYGWTKGVIATKRINQLVTLSETQLQAVNSLIRHYRKVIDKRKFQLRRKALLSRNDNDCI